jgi:hypothetical protein
MTRPESLFEAASYDLNQFIERRRAERRMAPRDTLDRRQAGAQKRTPPPQADTVSPDKLKH